MSLTSLLRGARPNQKEFQNILRDILPSKKEFQTYSGKEAFSSKQYESFVPYQLQNHDHSSVIGVAFDYLARIMLARMVPENRKEAYSQIAAAGGMALLKMILKDRPAVERRISKQFRKSIEKLEAFTHNHLDIKLLIDEVCFLAKLERIYRSGMPPANLLQSSFLDGPEDEVVKDLELLCDVFEETLIPVVRPTSEIVYNPHFGVASAFVGGADGDVLIDGVLYDVKTGKNPGYKWQEVAQLVGYYLLNELSYDVVHSPDSISIDSSFEHLKIKRLAFYRARYGEIEYVDINYFKNEIIEETKKKLAAYFAKNPNLSRPVIENLHILREMAK